MHTITILNIKTVMLCKYLCKQMFIATSGVNEWMIHNWVKESIHGMPTKKSTFMLNNDGKNDSETCIRSSINRRKLHFDAWVQS